MIGLFALWVLSPFAALAFVHERRPARPVVHTAMIAVALGSLAAYAVVALGPPRPKPAAWFLVVPAVSWLIAAVTLLATRVATVHDPPPKK